MASSSSAANATAAAKYWEYFQLQKEAITAMVAQSQDASQAVRELDSSLREAYIFLPPYDLKRFNNDLEELRALLQQKRGASKKQGFKFKSAVARPSNAVSTIVNTASPSSADLPVAEPTYNGVHMPPAPSTRPSYSFTGIDDRWIAADPLQLLGEDRLQGPTDCELRDISNSIVDLRPISHSLRALNCHRVQNSVVICGPFSGSATVRDSAGCAMVLGVRQFRLENSRAIDVYLFCTSHPIIERSSGVRFAPYPLELQSSQIQREFDATQLSSQPNSFDKVDDFNWLKRQASPNWSLQKFLPSANDWALLDDASRPCTQSLHALIKRMS
ncbi:hypothetical protein GGI02_003703 [Coemansia sp. RSA 2322]|nr:hypothetical protein GGI02_003703 [Coemansia sp. RSA 2322]